MDDRDYEAKVELARQEMIRMRDPVKAVGKAGNSLPPLVPVLHRQDGTSRQISEAEFKWYKDNAWGELLVEKDYRCTGCGHEFVAIGPIRCPECGGGSIPRPFKGTKWQPKPTDTPAEAVDAVAAKAAERRQALAARRGTTLDRDALTDRLVALGMAHGVADVESMPFIRKLASYFSVLDLKAIIEEMEKE